MSIADDLAGLTPDIDDTFADQSPGDALHQQDHDRIHRFLRAVIEVGADQDEIVALLAVLLGPFALHGADADFPRPNLPVVVWLGSVTPTNAIDGDFRIGWTP